VGDFGSSTHPSTPMVRFQKPYVADPDFLTLVQLFDPSEDSSYQYPGELQFCRTASSLITQKHRKRQLKEKHKIMKTERKMLRKRAKAKWRRSLRSHSHSDAAPGGLTAFALSLWCFMPDSSLLSDPKPTDSLCAVMLPYTEHPAIARGGA